MVTIYALRKLGIQTNILAEFTVLVMKMLHFLNDALKVHNTESPGCRPGLKMKTTVSPEGAWHLLKYGKKAKIHQQISPTWVFRPYRADIFLLYFHPGLQPGLFCHALSAFISREISGYPRDLLCQSKRISRYR